MGRFGGATDDVGFHRLRALLFQNGSQSSKRLHHLARLRRKRQVRGNQRPRLLEFVNQAVEAVIR